MIYKCHFIPGSQFPNPIIFLLGISLSPLILLSISLYSYPYLTTPYVFQVYRACREFIYDKRNLNETAWIEPEPKQWIECQQIIHNFSIHPFCSSLYELSWCFYIYLSISVSSEIFSAPSCNFPNHPILPAYS